ncbi:MAG: DUF1343 domain-containing protein, partial [Bacteroidetes bacterium]
MIRPPVVTAIILCCLAAGCRAGLPGSPGRGATGSEKGLYPVPGAARFDSYLPLIRGKNIALVANHTSMVAPVPGTRPSERLSDGEGYLHLVDTLLSYPVPGMKILKVFAPEHGFRGEKGAGDPVEDGKDPDTGIPVVSLYGDHRKPLPGDLEGVDLLLFDLQDVGTRFYTYISTLHYVMEACAGNGVH